MRDRHPHLRPLQNGLPWTSCTCNLGPRTVCKSHRDSEDWAVGISGQLVFDGFDGSRGGQLVLHEAKLVINLYPGDLFFFPSSCVTHSNLQIGEEETRRSLVLYTSGGLIRYLAQGLQTQTAWGSTASGLAAMKEHDAKAGERWEESWALFSKYDDLLRHNPFIVPISSVISQ